MNRNKLYYEVRIAKLMQKPTENRRLIAKMYRKIRNLEVLNDSCCGVC